LKIQIPKYVVCNISQSANLYIYIYIYTFETFQALNTNFLHLESTKNTKNHENPVRNPYLDILLVNHITMHAFRSVLPPQNVQVALFKVVAEAGHEAAGIFGKEQQLALMGLGRQVALETVLVAALLLAHLAKPAQLLQPLGLDPVGDGLGRQGLVFGHFYKVSIYV